MSSNLVKKFYQDVLEQLFEQSSALWEEEGLEESSMADLRSIWESKLLENGIDLSPNSGGPDHQDPAPPKASGRNKSKAAHANNSGSSSATSAATGNSGRKSRTSPQVVLQPEVEQPIPQPPALPATSTQAVHPVSQPQPIIHAYEREREPPQPILREREPPQTILQHHNHPQHTSVSQHALIREQNTRSLQDGILHSISQQQEARPAQISAGNHHHPTGGNSGSGPNATGMPTISLLPYSVPISGPIHLSAGKVINAGGLPGHMFSQQRPMPHQNHRPAPQQNQSANVDIQHIMRLSAASNQMRMNEMPQNIPQQNQRISMGSQHLSLEDRNRLMEHMNQVFRSQQQNGGPVINRMMPVNREIPQKYRQQNGGMPANQFAAMQYPNGNMLSMSNQFGFQQPSGVSQSSVIHVADSSGNQSALLLPVMHSLNDNVNNGGNPAGRGNIRKPGHTLPLQQLDGRDDDDDDEDIFQDLSDDDTSPKATTPRPAKKLKTGDRRELTERLEEEDLDSEDDDDNDDNTASVVDVIDNVVVCQYEKIGRTRNKWKLQLKSGMCSLNGKEYVFHKATGDAEF